jgi:hypothetical protein
MKKEGRDFVLKNDVVILRNDDFDLLKRPNCYGIYRVIDEYGENYALQDLYSSHLIHISKKEFNEKHISPDELEGMFNKKEHPMETSFNRGDYVFINSNEIGKFELARYVSFDCVTNSHIVLSRYGNIKSLDNDNIFSYEMVIEKQKDKIKELRENLEKDMGLKSIIDHMDEKPSLDFITRILNLQKEKETLEKIMVNFKSEAYEKQIKNIDKGIKRLSKRLYKFQHQYPNLDLQTVHDVILCGDYTIRKSTRDITIAEAHLEELKKDYNSRQDIFEKHWRD